MRHIISLHHVLVTVWHITYAYVIAYVIWLYLSSPFLLLANAGPICVLDTFARQHSQSQRSKTSGQCRGLRQWTGRAKTATGSSRMLRGQKIFFSPAAAREGTCSPFRAGQSLFLLGLLTTATLSVSSQLQAVR